MGKYSTLISTTWQRQLTYRFTIAAYRAGEIMETLFIILMWALIFRSQTIVGGYTMPEMISYLLFGNIITVATRNFLTDIMAAEIKNGALSLFLVKPITYFRYVMVREIGRISLPAILSIFTQIIVLWFFRSFINFSAPPLSWVIIIAMTLLAFISELLISYLVGLIAFWTDEVDGIYATILRLKKFISGSYFPLSLLPPFFVSLSFSLPFAYSFFVPTQVFLGKISLNAAAGGLLIQAVWIVLLYGIIRLVWSRGLKKYEGTGI